ncbi:uncharacterized protein LOC34623183 [Cyclospora cayetanensis]|uniref:Uncharacterized protein LOC34623183 n=1 Tax=Cyclospora cayetanensis TaxID=88456 RepID=A0A6P6S000_9EIME|nr:uncharacterized protein LOC34623183 [Cyclospora cayetanensis]
MRQTAITWKKVRKEGAEEAVDGRKPLQGAQAEIICSCEEGTENSPMRTTSSHVSAGSALQLSSSEGRSVATAGAEKGPSGGSLHCSCQACASSLLLLLLLRLGVRSLCAAPAANAVLFCGTCDEPHRQRRFFHRLLCAESEWPWFDMRGREEREALRGGPCKRPSGAPLRLASRREEYSALSRIGYKLLPHEGDSLERPPGAGNVRSPLDASGLAVQISDSLRSPEICTQAPPLLRFLTELPEALNTPPGLLMLLQPSRWLRPIERLGPCKLLALQQLTDKKRFGLFLSLVVRAAAAAAPRSTSAAASSEGGEGPSSSSSGRGPPPGEGRSHRSVPGRAVVAEAFLCCSRCCWRCGGLQRVTARGTVALCCCLEQSEWLSMLRSRFAYILLLFYGVLGPFEGLDGDVRAGSSADPSVPSGSAALMVADISHAGTETG